MFGVQAPTPGSGKGSLADAAAMIPTGRKAPLMVTVGRSIVWAAADGSVA